MIFKVVLSKFFVFYIHERVYEGRHVWSIVTRPTTYFSVIFDPRFQICRQDLNID